MCIDVSYREKKKKRVGESYAEERTRANERAHLELHFIINAIPSAYNVISLWWFASILQASVGGKNGLLVLSPSLPPTPAYSASLF